MFTLEHPSAHGGDLVTGLLVCFFGALVASLRRPNQFGFVHSMGRLSGCRLQHYDRRAIKKNVTPLKRASAG